MSDNLIVERKALTDLYNRQKEVLRILQEIRNGNQEIDWAELESMILVAATGLLSNQTKFLLRLIKKYNFICKESIDVLTSYLMDDFSRAFVENLRLSAERPYIPERPVVLKEKIEGSRRSRDKAFSV